MAADTKPEAKLLDHDYDGIRELDNQLPRWWLWLFYGSIVFAAAYLLYYDVFRFGYSQEEAYRAAVNPAYEREVSHNPLSLLRSTYHTPFHSPRDDRQRAMLLEGLAPLSNVEAPPAGAAVSFTEPLTDSASLEAGRQIFVNRCVACHGAEGQGGIGPNLTDNYWIHGGSFDEKVQVIVHGVPRTAMVPWVQEIKPTGVHQVASYIETLVGTNPSGAKAPEPNAKKVE